MAWPVMSLQPEGGVAFWRLSKPVILMPGVPESCGWAAPVLKPNEMGFMLWLSSKKIWLK